LFASRSRAVRVLWIRSNSEFEGLPEAERKQEAAFSEKLSPLATDLAKVNAEVVDVLNARLASAKTTAPPRAPEPAIKRKRELEKQILDGQVAIDKKRFSRYWGQAVFGFAGPTPTSDGKHVYAFFTTGVAACYDLEGNRKWIARGTGGGSEHGNFASPVLCDGRLIVWANEMRAYDAQTGAVAWTLPAKAFNTYGSMFRVRVGDEWVAGFQWGFFARARDGRPVWDQGAFGDSVTTPIVEGDTIFAHGGYPKYNDKTKGLKAFKIPNVAGAKMKPAYDFNVEWADDEIPVDKEKAPFDRGFVASPLFVDGLIYQVTQGGGLIVNDASTGARVYRKVPAAQAANALLGLGRMLGQPDIRRQVRLPDGQPGDDAGDRAGAGIPRDRAERPGGAEGWQRTGAVRLDAGVRGLADVLPHAGIPVLHRRQVDSVLSRAKDGVGMRHVVCVVLVLVALGSVADEPAWVNVTSNVGGETWGAYGVTYVKAGAGQRAGDRGRERTRPVGDERRRRDLATARKRRDQAPAGPDRI
jgi:hypothetical protein